MLGLRCNIAPIPQKSPANLWSGHSNGCHRDEGNCSYPHHPTSGNPQWKGSRVEKVQCHFCTNMCVIDKQISTRHWMKQLNTVSTSLSQPSTGIHPGTHHICMRVAQVTLHIGMQEKKLLCCKKSTKLLFEDKSIKLSTIFYTISFCKKKKENTTICW